MQNVCQRYWRENDRGLYQWLGILRRRRTNYHYQGNAMENEIFMTLLLITVIVDHQWDLVCDKGYYAQSSQTILVIGVMIGAILFTALSDYFGRKPVFFFSQWCMVVVGIICAFSPNIYFFFALRFFTGALQQVNIGKRFLLFRFFKKTAK